MTISFRRAARLAPVIALVAGVVAPRLAAADEWVERKFDPPIGSKWIIEREIDIEKNSGGTMVGHTQKDTALLTIEARNETGYVVTSGTAKALADDPQIRRSYLGY